MTVFLVRHGQTPWHGENRYAGRTDLPLDETGREQACWLAAWARDAGLAAVVCSPLRRAVDTAAPAAEAAGVAPARDSRLRELDFGQAEGLRLAELDPDVVRSFEADPAAHPLPGGEDPVAAAERARECLVEVAALGERVLVVAHNTLIRLALCRLLGIPLGEYRRRWGQVANVALTELALGSDGWALRAYNVPLPDRVPLAAAASPREEER